ncbi:GNAT family N-acetyltransferase [Streptomyces sp. DSM 44917]|uniref:GNAT family N-acetyltransferase n=1 Tax=Streptomyces boetiae TaxID=3075541 RepID=A0ABU2L1Y0_9ACTN|nr:GNAT family N-acetyltransferase [Streptomyces sp. DSM 44917]MDT0305559.1 GNAT family N-acetyltransferase [Streptomyces sp. DSM 44917]
MSLDTRFVAGDDAASRAWLRAVHLGFLSPPDLSDEVLAERVARMDLGRAQGAFDGDRCVATFRSFDQRLTVPGGGTVAADAISSVTVTATHRRRGLLSGMMAADLAAAKERGDVVATLIAAEYPIYGRFGFGPATTAVTWRVDVTRAGLDPRWAPGAGEGAGAGGELAFVDGAEVRKAAPEMYDRFRLGQAGAIDRSRLFWERYTGEVRWDEPWREPFHVLHRDADGVPQGLATFTTDDAWAGMLPKNTATVAGLTATSPAVERLLWRFVLSLDWVTGLVSSRTAPDAPLPAVLPDPRAASVETQADFLWLRPLDVPRMLRARTYPAAGELAIEVRDPLGLVSGRYLLAAGPEGADCAPAPAGRAADLTLSTGALAALYLGDVTASSLAAFGDLEEHTSGATARADSLFHTGRRPWCPDIF